MASSRNWYELGLTFVSFFFFPFISINVEGVNVIVEGVLILFIFTVSSKDNNFFVYHDVS